MEFRKLCVSDYQLNYLELLSQLTKTPEILRSEFNKFINLLNDSHQVWVLVTDNTIIGTGTILIEQKLINNFGKVCHIEDIVIDAKYRGQGIGLKIIKHLTEIAKSQECYKVILDCKEDNELFYNKCGLTKTGIQMSEYLNYNI